MAYTSAYPYDIFISYAHDDNDVLSAETGWVTQFHNYLENWLIKCRRLKGLTIWFDDQLNGNTAFDQAIQDGINNSALFFVLHSGNYQDSDYCRKELNWFLEENNKHPTGVMLGDESRIFNILIENIKHKDWCDDLSGTSGFKLHDAKEDEFGYPISPKAELFNQQMRELVEATASILEKMPKHKPVQKQVIPANSNSPKIFIADVADTLQPFRKRLINEIGDKAIILPSLPPPYEAIEHQKKLNQTLGESSLTIHLLDQWAGRKIDGLEELSFPRLQAETAANHSQQSLIWVPDTLNADEIEDEQQAAWLQELESGTRNTAGFQFVRSNRQSFIEQVNQMVEELQSNTRKTEEANRFLIDTHQKDQHFAFQLASLLSGKAIDVSFNQESSDPVESLESFEQAVKEVQNLIIMFGSVAPTWLKGRIEKAIKIVANQLGSGTTTLDAIWVFMLPNCPGMESVGEFPKLLKINCLDNSASQTIDNGVIESLLNPQGGK